MAIISEFFRKTWNTSARLKSEGGKMFDLIALQVSHVAGVFLFNFGKWLWKKIFMSSVCVCLCESTGMMIVKIRQRMKEEYGS